MRKQIFIIFFLFASLAHAALAPRYQHAKDLDVLVQFIKQHPRVLSSLRTIDFEHFTIHFGSDCQAVFGRKVVERPPGLVGPAGPLMFRESNCDVD